MSDEKVPAYRCPCCKRRLSRKLREPLPCRVCGKPVEYIGAGRPPLVHYECRDAYRKMREP